MLLPTCWIYFLFTTSRDVGGGSPTRLAGSAWWFFQRSFSLLKEQPPLSLPMCFVMNHTLWKRWKVHHEELKPLGCDLFGPTVPFLSLRASLSPHPRVQSSPTPALWTLRVQLNGNALTVGSHAVRDGGRSEGVALLRVDELAHGRQLVHAVHFVEGWRAVTIRRLRLHRGPGNTNRAMTVSGC